MGSARINAVRQRIAVKRSKLPSIGEAWDTLNIGTRERVLNHSGEGGGGIPYKRLMDKDPYRDPHGGKDDFTRIRYVVGDPKKIEVEDINVKKGVDYHYRDGPYFAEYEKRFQKAINTPFNKQSSYLKEAIERGLREQGINHRSEIRPDAPPINLPYGDYGEHETAGMKRDRQRFTKLKQRLGVTGMPKDFGKKRKRFKEDKDIDKLVDDITDIVMKERRQNLKDSSKHGRPEGMRKDLSTPLIKEVPFGPEKYPLGAPDFGDLEAYEHIDHRPFTDLTFEEAEAKAKEMGLPEFEEQIGIPKELRDKSKAFHVIPHGGISIPKEQKRKQLPIEKRNWDKNKRLITRGNMQDKRRQDAEEIALDIMNDEKPSRLVNRRTKKIRPPKPVRSDFAEIITAKQKSARVEALRQRMALNEEPFIVDKTSNRPSFLTPNGNYIGRNIRTKEQLYSDSNTHSGLIEGFGDKNPNEIYDYGDYTDNPRILDFMDRENMIRVSDHPTQNSFEILNEPTRQQLRSINKEFKEDDLLGRDTVIDVWGLDKDGSFGPTAVENRRDFNKLMKTNVWKNNLDKTMQEQIKPQWLPEKAGKRPGAYNRRRYHFNLSDVSKKAKQKSARVETLRQRLGIRDYIQKHKLAKEGDYGPSGVKGGTTPGKRFPPLKLTPDDWNKVIDRASKVKDSNIWREQYDAAEGGNTMGFITTDGILYESVGYDANHIGAVREIMEKGKVDPYIYDKFAGNMGPESWMAESQVVRFFDTGKMSMGGGFDEDYTNEHRQLNFQNIEGQGPHGTPTSAQMETIGSINGTSGLQPSQIVTELGDYGYDRFVRRRLQLHKYPNGDPGAFGSGFLGSKQRIAIKPDGRRINAVRQRIANGRIFPTSFIEDKRRKKKITPRSIPKDRQEVPDIDLTGEGKYIRRFDNPLQKQMFRRQKVRRKKALNDAIQHGIGAAEHDPEMKKMLSEYIESIKHDFAHNPADYAFISPRVGSPVHSDITAPEKKYYTKTPLEHSKPAYYTKKTLQKFTKLNKSARIQMARERLGGVIRDIEKSHEGPVTDREADKAIKKFYKDKDAFGKDEFEYRELEGGFEVGEKRLPLQKVNQPFHSKKPFLRSFTVENARKLAKRKRNV